MTPDAERNVITRTWKRGCGGWVSNDGAVVKIDQSTECSTSRPWLANYRGFIAYLPGPFENMNYLHFTRRNSRFHIPRKFKTAEAAMQAVDRECEVQEDQPWVSDSRYV